MIDCSLADLASQSHQPNTYTLLGTGEEFWGKVKLFQYLPKELYPQLRECSEEASFKAGETIIRQGENGEEFFIIREGQARVEIDGKKRASLRNGDYFGENSLLNQAPRAASIIAVSDVTTVKIHRNDFQRLSLHKRLNFPKRDKINKRHQMMASVAGMQAGTRDQAEILLGGIDMKSSDAYRGRENVSWTQQQRNILWQIFSDRVNITAFLFVPLGLISNHMEVSPAIVFGLNFLAIIPLASILGAATETMATHTGHVVGGLLNATFGNAVEVIMCMQAVKAGLIQVVQSNLLGSILSNLLLVLGMAIFASGIARKTQKFQRQGAASSMTCQLVASISVCLPTCVSCMTRFHPGSVLEISRICSLLLMLVYGLFLFFMLKTHANLFSDEDEEGDDEENLSVFLSVLLWLGTTLTVFACSQCLIASIEGVCEDVHVSQAFIGVILLPIVGNAAEHATAVTCAHKGMMDLALGVAVGSSTQIALFVVPLAILFGWIYDQPMNLNFSAFDTTCQMLTVFLVSQVLSLGETTWFHGLMLMTVYCIIAVQTLFIQEDGELII